MAEALNIDFDALTVGEVDFLEDTLNEKLRPLLGDRIITFQDVLANFRDGGDGAGLKIPQGKILRTMAWMQLRKTNPDATWEDAGALELVAAPKALASTGNGGEPTTPSSADVDSKSWPDSAATGSLPQPTTTR
jgi:hypothetical protein